MNTTEYMADTEQALVIATAPIKHKIDIYDLESLVQSEKEEINSDVNSKMSNKDLSVCQPDSLLGSQFNTPGKI